jgi:hypothetical protein
MLDESAPAPAVPPKQEPSFLGGSFGF